MKKQHKFLTVIGTLALAAGAFTLYNHSIEVGNGTLAYSQHEVDEMVEQAKEEGRKSVLEIVKTALEEGNTVISVLKQLYPDYIVAVSSGSFHFVEILDDIEKNPYTIDNLQVTADGEYQYVVDGEVVSKKGIDVSSHQGDIDWNKVAADGVEFTFIRALYRGYTTGEINVDKMFEKNIKGAKSAGIQVGVYVFTQAISEEEAIEEADMVCDMVAEYDLDLPIVYDVEKVSSTSGRQNVLTTEERTKVTKAFLERVKERGYTPMIYHNTEMGAVLIDISKLTEYNTWLANYNQEFYWPYSYSIWQYSAKGSVDGIKGDVDMDIMLSELK